MESETRMEASSGSRLTLRSAVLLAAVAVAACSSAPVSFMSAVPPGKDAAFECAVAQLNIMGYTIEDGNEGLGFVRGRKQTSGLGVQILTGGTYHDVLTASAFDNPSTGNTQLRVVVTRIIDEDTSLLPLGDDHPERGENVVEPSESGKADAKMLLATCGASDVSGLDRGDDTFALEGTTTRSPGLPLATLPTESDE